MPASTRPFLPPRGSSLLRMFALAAGVFVAACSVQTKIPDLNKDAPAAWQIPNAGTGLQPDLKDWWHAFDDAALNALIERALKDNLNVQIAAERFKAARALRHRSRGDFWPNLNFRTYVETAPNASTGYLEMGFDASWEFGFFGRSQANARTYLADENAAIVDQAAARVSVIAEVAKNYIELRAAQARAALLDDVLEQRRKQVALSEVKLRTRLASQLEVDRARNDLQQALSDAAEPATTIVQTQQALAVLLGTTDVDPILTTATAQPKLPTVAIRQAPADLLRTRPEIRRAEQNVLKAAGDLGIARADMYPKFGIAGTFISSTALTGDVNRLNDFVPIAGPVITIPLIDWGARRQVVNAREAALSAAVLAYREAVLEGIAEAQIALAQFDSKSVLVDNARASFDFAEHSAQSAQILQRIGLSDGLDSANAGLALAQSKLQQALAQRDRSLAYIALYKSFGGAIPPLRADLHQAPPE